MKETRVVGPGFRTKVYDVVQTIPEGKVMTYGDIALTLGSPKVARHVGWALSALSSPEAIPSKTSKSKKVYHSGNVPWHRVVNATGKISGKGDSSRGTLQKNKLIEDGIVFGPNGKIDFEQYRWRQPTNNKMLKPE